MLADDEGDVLVAEDDELNRRWFASCSDLNEEEILCLVEMDGGRASM
jgi:hypothetical protein